MEQHGWKSSHGFHHYRVWPDLNFICPPLVTHWNCRPFKPWKHTVKVQNSHQNDGKSLNIFSIFTDGDSMYFNGGYLLVLWVFSWCVCTAALSQETFALHFGRRTAGPLFQSIALGWHALHGWKKFPFTHAIRFGNLIEVFSRANRYTYNIFGSFRNMVAWVIEGEAQGVFVGGILPVETLAS